MSSFPLLAATSGVAVGGAWPTEQGRKLLVQYLAVDGPKPADASEFYSIPEYRTALVDFRQRGADPHPT